jgi:hypothetical protein
MVGCWFVVFVSVSVSVQVPLSLSVSQTQTQIQIEISGGRNGLNDDSTIKVSLMTLLL